MLTRTHLLAALFLGLIFLPEGNKIIFFSVLLVASLIPDIDSRFSKIGKRKAFRILQFFVRHRGIIHSFLFLLIIGGVLYYFFPVAVFPFLLGYGSHLLADGISRQGVRAFYPFKWKIKGFVKVGGRFETILFVLLLIGNLFLIFQKILS